MKPSEKLEIGNYNLKISDSAQDRDLAQPKAKPRFRLGFTLGLTLLLSLALLLQASYLLWGEWSFDQGHYLLVAQLVEAGYAPYAEIFMSEPPLMLWSASLPLSFFGSVAGMQLMAIGYGLLALAALVSIGASLDNKWTGLLAGALLAFNFVFFFDSRKVMPEIPSMSFGLVSLALALRYRRSGRRFHLAISGAAMGLSMLFKYFMPWITPLIFLIAAMPAKSKPGAGLAQNISSNRRRIVQNGLIWVGSLLGVVLISSLLFDLGMLLSQTILFHLYKSGGTERNLLANVDKIRQTFAGQPVLSICAVIGLGWAGVNFRRKGWIPLLWLALAVVFLFLYSPLRSKHLVVLYPIMALLAALGLTLPGKLWRRRPAVPGPLRWSSSIGAIILLVLLLFELARPYEALAQPRKSMVSAEMQPLLELLTQFTSPGDCLITDNPYLAFAANRDTPPWLANLSYARFAGGTLDKETMVAITEAEGCQVVAPTLDRLKNSNRPYYDWAKANYLRVWVLEGKEIMLGKPLTEAQPMLPMRVTFADQVTLLGADWQLGPAESSPSRGVRADTQPQQAGYLSLYWHTDQPFSQDYKIFVQLRDEAGQTVANADHEAYNGLVPTSTWPVGAIFKDTNRITWPDDLPPGSYSLYVGFYDPVTFERIPIIGDTSGENAVVIRGIDVPTFSLQR